MDTSLSGTPDDVPAGFHDHSLQGIYELGPVPLQAAMLEPFGTTHFVDRSDGPLKTLFQDLSGEGLRDLAFGVRGSVRLVQDNNHLTHLPAYFLHQREFLSCDRGIGADNHQR